MSALIGRKVFHGGLLVTVLDYHPGWPTAVIETGEGRLKVVPIADLYTRYIVPDTGDKAFGAALHEAGGKKYHVELYTDTAKNTTYCRVWRWISTRHAALVGGHSGTTIEHAVRALECDCLSGGNVCIREPQFRPNI